MPRRARVISIDLDAGTAKFFEQMHAANGELRKFGKEGVSNVQATSGALRVLEGNMTNNLRAAERFVANILGLGPILQAAFPLVGAVALLGVVGELGKRVTEFYTKLRDGAEKAAGSFRALNDPLRATNDALQVANDKLDNEIAKLEGHHENTLKLALDEARKSADDLAEALNRDLVAMNAVLEKNKAGLMEQFVGRMSDKGLREELGGKTGTGGFIGNIADINEEGRAKIQSAKAITEADAARKELDAKLQKAYGDMIAQIDSELKAAKDRRALQRAGDKSSLLGQQLSGGFPIGNENTSGSAAIDIRNYGPLIEELTGVRRALGEGSRSVGLREDNALKTEKLDALRAGAANDKEDRPFKDRMNAIRLQIDEVRSKMEEIGKPESAQIITKAFSAAEKAIEETNKSLEKMHKSLTVGEGSSIRSAELTLAQAQSEELWQSKLVTSATSIDARIRSTQALTAAIGKGVDAAREAFVQTKLFEVEAAHSNDPEWMKNHEADLYALRAKLASEFNAEQDSASKTAIDQLTDQLELEKALAGAQSKGIEAVRQAGLAVRERQQAEKGATKDQLDLERKLSDTQRENATGAALAKLNERIDATERLTVAIKKGAEAVRQANLETKLGEIARGNPGGQIGPQGAATIIESDALHKQQVAEAATQNDRLFQIGEQIKRLKEERAVSQDILAVDIQLRKLENERIQQLVQESLGMRGARDGVRAFFIEMQEDAKSSAQIVYESLNSAIDKVSSSMAKLATHQKTAWADAFKSIGEEMAQSQIKSTIQKGLAAVGKHFGIDIGKGKPDGTKGNPIWVQMAGGGTALSGKDGAAGMGPWLGSPDGSDSGGVFGGSKGGFIFSMLKSFGGFRASGGGVDPGHEYTVGENGPERFVPSTPGSIIPNGGGKVEYHIDARGADLGAHNRIARGIEASHNAAVSNSVKANVEKAKRNPQR